MLRKIKNTTPGGLGHYIGEKEREHVFFPGGAVTEVDEKKLADAYKDPIVKSWFESGSLVDQTNAIGAPPAPPAPVKSEEDKGAKR